MRRQLIIRIRVLIGILVAVTFVMVGRLYMLQVVHSAGYRIEANNQYVRTTSDIFNRGSIYVTQKDGTLLAAAALRIGYIIAIDPSKLIDIDGTYRTLAAATPIDREAFYASAHKQNDPYEEVAHHVDERIIEGLRKASLPGVQFFREQWRYYPGESLASHVLGFVGFDDDGVTETGRVGLERYWQTVLDRQNDRLYVNFFAEVFANVQHAFAEQPAERPGDVVTTIEPVVQHELESTLADTEKEWHAKQLAGIILDPKTGAVYAMASLPTFNPNTFEKEESVGVYRNPFVEDVFEMGSIIKPLAMAIGLDTGAVTLETTYDDTGSVTLNGYTIRNYDGRARGVVNMQEVLNQSLNVGMAFVAKRVGGPTLSSRMKGLGFGEETGIDLPFETRGLISNLDNPRDVEYATAAFGQGIALTPIETARALAALGNGGYLVTPHIASRIQYDNGAVTNVTPADSKQVFSKQTSETITRMLVHVVDTALRGGEVKKEHYSIAAKTGTAQIAKKGARGYYDDRYLHSFFGYFPAYDPKFLVFLYHVEPQGAKYASETLTDPFMKLADFLINYYQVPPDR